MLRKRSLSLTALALAALSLASLSAHAQSNVRYENLVPPGTSGIYLGTTISSTGNTYTAVNLNLDTGALSSVVVSNGVTTPFAISGQPADTYVRFTGINESGTATGWIADLGNNNLGAFLYSGGTTINPVPANGTEQRYNGVNSSGKVAMGYRDTAGLVRGAIYDTTNQTFTDIPAVIADRNIDATGISSNGVVLGHYRDASNVKHGYTYSNGNFTLLPDVPGIANPPDAFNFEYTGINANGLLCGYYYLSGSDFGSFLYNGSAFTFLNYPGAVNTDIGWNISDTNQLVGTYYLPDGLPRAFLATVVPEPGTIALFVGMASVGITLRRRSRKR